MYLRIWRILKGIFLKLRNRLVGLYRFILDYKIITFSILYVLLNAVCISVLRNIKVSYTIGLIVTIPLVMFSYFLKNRLRRSSEVILKKSEWRIKLVRSIGTIFELFFFVSVIGSLVLVRVGPFLRHESEIEGKVLRFTASFTNVVGYISDEPIEKHRGQHVVVKLLEDTPVEGEQLLRDDTLLLIKTSSFYKLHLGQLCQFRGTLEIPESFEGFDYGAYLRDRKIFLLMNNPIVECESTAITRKGSVVRNWLVDNKNSMIATIDKVLNEPQSSLLAGIIFGQKRLFNTAFDEATRVAGLSHIVAASGYNVTILVIVAERIFFFLPKKWRVIVGLIVIWMFAILSGLSSSIVRACIMGSISLLAIIFGRSNTVHIAIPLASALFVLIKPLILFDIGFLLSVSAVVGLTYVLPILIDIKQKITKKLPFVENNILPTLACTLSTIPVSILSFKTISIWAVISNTLILPIIDTTMFLGIFGIMLWNIFKPFAFILFGVANMQLKYFEFVTNLIYKLNWGQIHFSDTSAKVVSLVFLGFILLLTIYLYPIKNEQYNYYLKTDS